MEEILKDRTNKKFEKILIKNYRGIKEIELDKFSKYNFYVGDNSSCKTTLLEALFNSLPGNVSGPITTSNSRGMIVKKENIENFVYNANSEEKIELILNDEIITEIKISENKDIDNDKLVNITNQFIGSEASEGMEFLYNISKKRKNYSFLEMDFLINKIYKIDMKDKIRDVFTLGKYLNEFKTGCWISPFTKYQRDTAEIIKRIIKDKQKQKLLDLINIFEKEIDDIISDEGEIFLSKKNIRKMLPLSSFGNGIAAIIDIISSIILEDTNFLFIDEIETGIHFLNYPKLCKALLELTENKNIQLFITTHSSEFLNNFYNESMGVTDSISLYRFQKNNGELKKVYYSKEKAMLSLKNGWDVR